MALKTLFDILCVQLKSLSETLHHWLKTSLQREQAVDKVRPDSFVAWDIDLELPAPTLQQARNPYREASSIYQALPPYLAPLKVRPTSNIDEGDKGKPLYSCNTTPPLPPPNVNSKHREELRISSIGLNATILKDLMEECREKYLKEAQRKISVFENREGEWKKAKLRPVRPISTVIMDEEVKDDILRDVDEFLDQDMQDWYAERGIPYKRGYLLFGPPGTGKSSFSLSLAGKHELDIYTLQLSNISDSTLMKLFAELPPRSIVLLEDVDTAGVGRRGSVDTDQDGNSQSAVTLSGLLNVLDGVSSQEGRILIMTTNHIDHLDEALVRPGRSDKKVHFKLADQNMSTQLFRTVFKQLPNKKQCNERYDDETIEGLAREFASKVPEQVFSPAEALSFLLERKKSPYDAVSGIESWVAKARD
ncbi:hypothetical protein AtubIFM54640_010719 [Aspergillus tubingensis]|nr:hypothetical protein AtubIFM54640_010719 [Aspergillus tubingensis]